MAKKKKPKKNEVQRVAGRPSKYQEEFAHMAYCMSLTGMIDIQIAEAFEVDESTFTRWKQRYPALRDSLRRGKAVADAQVGEALFTRAIGFTHVEERVIHKKKADVIRKVTQYYPPDVTACIFWLKNRMKAQWRETMEHQVGLTFPELMKRGLLKAKELNNEE